MSQTTTPQDTISSAVTQWYDVCQTTLFPRHLGLMSKTPAADRVQPMEEKLEEFLKTYWRWIEEQVESVTWGSQVDPDSVVSDAVFRFWRANDGAYTHLPPQEALRLMRRSIRSAFIDLWRKHERETRTFEEMLAETMFADMCEASSLTTSEYIERLADCISSLKQNRRLVIQLRYRDGHKNEDVATILRLTPSRASQIHGKALDDLRQCLSQVYT